MKSQLKKGFANIVKHPEKADAFASEITEELRESFKRGLRLGHAQAKDKKARFRKGASNHKS